MHFPLDKGVNLLAGRALTYHMYPLTAIELGADFNFVQVLKYGALPSLGKERNPQRFLASYPVME